MSRSAYHCMLSIIGSSEYTEVVQNTNFLIGNDSTSILCNILTVLGAVLNNILPCSIAATLQPFKGHSLASRPPSVHHLEYPSMIKIHVRYS